MDWREPPWHIGFGGHHPSLTSSKIEMWLNIGKCTIERWVLLHKSPHYLAKIRRRKSSDFRYFSVGLQSLSFSRSLMYRYTAQHTYQNITWSRRPHLTTRPVIKHTWRSYPWWKIRFSVSASRLQLQQFNNGSRNGCRGSLYSSPVCTLDSRTNRSEGGLTLVVFLFGIVWQTAVV